MKAMPDQVRQDTGLAPAHRLPRSYESFWRSAATVAFDVCSGVVAVVVAAADETSHAEARLAKPSQASQSREGLTNGIGYICDQAQGVLDHET